MQSLADALSGASPARGSLSTRQYRRGVGFVLDPRAKSTKLDRNAKVRLLVAVEIMERTTKAKGRRNGWVSVPGLTILRTLLLRFHNASTGLCCPSLDTLQAATGLCRQTIITALRRLEAVGVLVITRRIVRLWQGCGRAVVRQGSNLYAFRDLPAQVAIRSAPSRGRFPRVHGVGANQNRALKPKPVWMQEGVFEGSGTPVDQDWRHRARALITKS